MFMHFYVYVRVYGAPKLQVTTLHMKTLMKMLLIALYFIAITQVSLPELTATCSAQICMIELWSAPC